MKLMNVKRKLKHPSYKEGCKNINIKLIRIVFIKIAMIAILCPSQYDALVRYFFLAGVKFGIP